MMKSPMAPEATHRPRKVQTGISASVNFINGQFNPHPSVSSVVRTHIERGRVVISKDEDSERKDEVQAAAEFTGMRNEDRGLRIERDKSSAFLRDLLNPQSPILCGAPRAAC